MKKPSSKPKAAEPRIDRNIYRRGEYSFQVKLMVGGNTIAETFNTLQEARAFRDAKRAAVVLDPDYRKILENRVRKTEAAAATLEKLLDRYEAEETVKKKSASSEKYRIGKLKRYAIAKSSIYTISADEVTQFLDDLAADGVAAPGRRKYCALLSHLYKIAVKRWRYKVINPIRDIELPSAGRARKRRLQGDEEARLLAALDQENPIAGAFARVAIETAMRRGEMLGLQWEDVRGRVALLHDTKNGEAREASLSSTARKVLRGLPKPHNGLVFRIHRSALRGAWARACVKAGIKDLRIHDLRHEALSRLSDSGKFSMLDIMALAGHKTPSQSGAYVHANMEELARRMG